MANKQDENIGIELQGINEYNVDFLEVVGQESLEDELHYCSIRLTSWGLAQERKQHAREDRIKLLETRPSVSYKKMALYLRALYL